MAQILNRDISQDKGHNCLSELPGKRVYSTISPESRSGIPYWTVARCSCGQLWSAWPYVGDINWKPSKAWARMRYRNVGLDKEA